MNYYKYSVQNVYSKTDTLPSGRSKDVEYHYNGIGQLVQEKLGNNYQTLDYSYNIRNWLESINDVEGRSNFSMHLEYTDNGNIKKQKWVQSLLNLEDPVQYAYSYDAANRLTGANFTGSGYNSSAFDVTYSYDKDGNLTHFMRNSQTGYPAGLTDYMSLQLEAGSNRIDYLRDEAVYTHFNVEYDANGNVMENVAQGLTGALYDARNLPLHLQTGSGSVQYAYNAEGLRTEKRIGNTVTHYVRGKDGEVLASYVNNAIQSQPIYAGGEMIGNYDRSQRRYYIKDHLGSIRTTVDESGVVVGYDDYYPYGLIMSGRSSNTGNPNADYKFTGYEVDDDLGLNLYNANARLYDPIIGRFMQVDPLAKEFPNISPYIYGNNNPLRYTDPTGKAPMDDIYLNSKTNEYIIIRTDDEYDVLYVDGEVAGATDVSAWEDGASIIYDSYTGYFIENSWAISGVNWLGNFNRAERMEVKQGIFNARMAMGQKNALITMTKIGAAGAAGISTMGIGTGVVAGSWALIGTGIQIGSIGTALSTGESLLQNDYVSAGVKVATGFGFGRAYSAISNNPYSNAVERKALQVVTNILEWNVNISIGTIENKRN